MISRDKVPLKTLSIEGAIRITTQKDTEGGARTHTHTHAHTLLLSHSSTGYCSQNSWFMRFLVGPLALTLDPLTTRYYRDLESWNRMYIYIYTDTVIRIHISTNTQINRKLYAHAQKP